MSALGIHDLSLATASNVLTLDALAEYQGVDPAKYHIGLGQDEMSVPGPDEDIVTMAAAAALPIIQRHGTDGIRTLFFATESGIDQSKSAGVFVHRLLGLPASCRVVELKQACYSATAGLQAAFGIIARHPGERVLVIASDVAKYDLDSAAEATQGAAAVAMLVSADPALLQIEPATGVFTADVDDFWRPNDSSTAVVNGKLSIGAYLDAFTAAWDDYLAQGGAPIESFARFAHHQPFTKMAAKAHARLAEHTGTPLADELYAESTRYNRRVGNGYTASLYVALAALLDADADLTGQRIGMFSYGSGSVSEFFAGVVVPGYREALRTAETAAALEARVPVTIERYRALHGSSGVAGSEELVVAPESAAPFHFTGVSGRARGYARD